MSIDVERLSFSYGAHPVLRDVSFRAEPGQLVAVLGPNGAGTVSYTHLTLPTNREV